MNRIRETLWADYTKVSELIGIMEDSDKQLEFLFEERDKIRNEIIKLEQSELESNVKKRQIEAEDKREQIRNQINITTFVVTTGVSIYAIVKTFKFDQGATVTSTLGRNILNGVVPKMFKR